MSTSEHQPPPSGAPADAHAQTRPDEAHPPAGSPAAPVMKQFSKTEAESGGRR